MNKLSVLTEIPGTIKLSPREREIYSLIVEAWPTSALELAEHLGENLESREQRRKISTKYTYYLHKLIEKRLILSKRVGNAIIVWPLHTEKYRAIHEMLGK